MVKHERLLITKEGSRWKKEGSVIYPSDYPRRTLPFKTNQFLPLDQRIVKHRHSDTVVRLLDYTPQDYELLSAELQVLADTYKISSVAFQPIIVGRYEDGQYMAINFTRFIHGYGVWENPNTLRKLKKTNIVEECENFFENLIRYYLDRLNSGVKCLWDLDIFQMLYDPEQRSFVLVDIDPRFAVLDSSYLTVLYEWLIRAIQTVERIFVDSKILSPGTQLQRSRQSLSNLERVMNQ